MAAIEKTVTPIEAVWDRREESLASFCKDYKRYDEGGGRFQKRVNQFHKPSNGKNDAILECMIVRDLDVADSAAIRLQYFCAMMTDYGIPDSVGETVSESFNKMKRILRTVLPKEKEVEPIISTYYGKDIHQAFTLPEGADEKAITEAAQTYLLVRDGNKLEKMRLACRTMLNAVTETGDAKKDSAQKEIAMSKMRAFLGEIHTSRQALPKPMRVGQDGKLST